MIFIKILHSNFHAIFILQNFKNIKDSLSNDNLKKSLKKCKPIGYKRTHANKKHERKKIEIVITIVEFLCSSDVHEHLKTCVDRNKTCALKSAILT